MVSQKSALAVEKAADNLKFNFNIREVSIVQVTVIVTEAVVVQVCITSYWRVAMATARAWPAAAEARCLAAYQRSDHVVALFMRLTCNQPRLAVYYLSIH